MAMSVAVTVTAIDKLSPALRKMTGNIGRMNKSMEGAGLGKFERRMQGAGAATQAFNEKWSGTFAAARGAGVALTGLGAIIVGVGVKSVQTASDVAEMESKFKAVFKEGTEDAEKWATDTGAAVNRSKYDLMGYMATLQDTFVPMGVARDEAAGLSKEVTKLAVDLASFNNTAEPDVIRDMQSALVGNHETVRKYGVIITQAALDQELLNMGFEGGAKAASEQQKMMARLNIITASTTDAQGDAERTAGSFANQMKGLQAQIKEVTVELGKALLPIIQQLMPPLISMAKVIAKIASTPMGKALAVVTAGFGLVAIAVGPLLIVLPQVLSAWNALTVMAPGLTTALSGITKGMWGMRAGSVGATTGITKSLVPAITGLGSKLGAMAAAAGPIMLVVAALAIMIYSLNRTYQMFKKAGDEASEAKRKWEEFAATEARVSEERGAGDIAAGQAAERERASQTLGDRFWGAMTGGGVTGKDLAQQRVHAGQASPLSIKRQDKANETLSRSADAASDALAGHSLTTAADDASAKLGMLSNVIGLSAESFESMRTVAQDIAATAAPVVSPTQRSSQIPVPVGSRVVAPAEQQESRAAWRERTDAARESRTPRGEDEGYGAWRQRAGSGQPAAETSSVSLGTEIFARDIKTAMREAVAAAPVEIVVRNEPGTVVELMGSPEGRQQMTRIIKDWNARR